MLSIIDYGVGNFLAIERMLRRVGVNSQVVSDKQSILDADKIILPGVGAFKYAMDQLYKMDLIDSLTIKATKDKIPILGICLGSQLLFESSEEGSVEGLGWIKGRIIKFEKDRVGPKLKIPNMGWSEVSIVRESSLISELASNPRFYFAHSYHMVPQNNEDAILKTNYGYEFVTGVQRENIFGVQFHPEKSHKFGMKLLSNFASI